MTYFNVHWKGRPHRHLPRIRVVSCRGSVYSRRSVAQAAADQVWRRPLSPTLQKERKRQRFQFRFRPRRTRTSRSFSSAAQACRRPSLRARQNIQVFGWNSAAELASIVSDLSARHPSSIRLKPRPKPSSALRSPIITTNTATIPSTDGAGGIVFRRVKGIRSNKANSHSRDSVDFSKNPLYISSNDPRRTTQKTAPVSPLETAPRKVTYGSSQGFKRGGVYDARVDPKIGAEVGYLDYPSKASDTRRTTFARKASEKSRNSKTFGMPAFWEAASSTVPAASGTIKSIVTSILSDTASRTPSQRKALKKFKKELELYLQATRSLPKQPLITSPSATTVSANTIKELKPYQTEFQSAGLAVTSQEQKGMALGKSSKSQKVPTAPPEDSQPSPKKSRMSYESNKTDGKSNTVTKKAKQPSYASGSTGTTVMGFTPPHEKAYDDPKTPIARRQSSSDQTIVDFTPPHERLNKPVDPTPRTPTKKSLPWLRKLEIQPEPPTTKRSSKSKVHADDIINEIVLPTSAPRKSLSSSETMASPIGKEPGRSPKPHDSSSQVRGNPLKYSNAPAHMATQTSRSSEIEKLAPVPSGPSKTFPLVADKIIAEPPLDMSRQSRVQWKGVDEAIQTHGGGPTVGLRCTQCDGEIEQKTQPEAQMARPEAEYQCPRHISTSRSSLQCQQCFPSRQASSAISPLQSPTSLQMIPSRLFHNKQAPVSIDSAQGVILGYGTEENIVHIEVMDDSMPNPDPIKRPTRPKLKLRPTPTPQPQKNNISRSRTKALPCIPQPPPIVLLPLGHSVSTSTSLGAYSSLSEEISDNAVFRGLHVATAAACDEDVDKWIEEITGCGVRKFLAELSKFDGLGFNTLAGVAKRAAKQRRNEVRGWEMLRELRMRDQKKSGPTEEAIEDDMLEGNDDRDEGPVVYEKVRAKRNRKERASEREELLQSMRHTRECKGSERVRERAVRMGWRDKSVAACA